MNRDKDTLVVNMMPLANYIAFQIHQHLPPHIELSDLQSDAMLGLVRAARDYDPARKIKFYTYARHRIHGAVIDGLRANDPATRDTRRKQKRLEMVVASLSQLFCRPPQHEEIAKALRISLFRLAKIVREVATSTSEADSAGDNPCLCDSVESNDAGPFDQCLRKEYREIARRAMLFLHRAGYRQYVAVLSRFYWRSMTMKEIGNELGVGERRVYQLRREAIKLLRSRTQYMSRLRDCKRAANDEGRARPC